MAHEKIQKLLINSSHDVTMITKPTSTISQSYIDDYFPNLNLSFSQTEKSKLRPNDYPVLKRSQSHKRHHFKVDIRTIVNEELNEDDSENITMINYSQSFSSSESDLEIITNFAAPSNIESKDDNLLSPKTKLMITNLLIDTNKKDQSCEANHFFLEDNNEFKLFHKKNGEYLGHEVPSSPEYEVNEVNDINNEVIGIIPTIMGRIMKEEAIGIDKYIESDHDDNNTLKYKSTNNEFN